MRKHLTGFTMALALFALAVVVTTPALKAAGAPDSEQVNKLLSEAKTQAFQLKEDASTMQSYTQSSAGWETHSTAVNQMRDHINSTARTLTQLDEGRKNASPWQAAAIDKIRPLLKEIATNTETVIQYINKNPKRLTSSEYKDYIETNADVTSKLAGLISDYVEYGNTKDRLERLSRRLEVPGK